MATIFLDESGYTGEDLLNKIQPFFVLASLSLSEDDCTYLKNFYFNKVKEPELKHVSLARLKKNHPLILNFLKDFISKPQYFKVAVSHKQFALVAKIVDLVIEPAMYHRGFDLYNKGGNISITNLFYNTIPIFGGQIFFNELLTRFQSMIRLKTIESYESFFNYIGQKQKSKELEQELDMLLQAQRQLGKKIINDLPDNVLDIALTQAMVTMSEWRKQTNEEIILIHDISTNMSKQQFIWNALMSSDLAPITVGYDRRKWHFPIGVSKTIFEKSENWSGLQLADIIAGAFSRAARWQYITQDNNDSYGRNLLNIIKDINIIPLLPGSEITPEELGTTGSNDGDPNEYLGKIIRETRNSTDHDNDIY